MGIKVDIDALLADDELEITLCGETYTIKDISMDVFLAASREEESASPETLHEQLAVILGVEKEKLSDLGLKASGLALNEIRKWVLQSSGVDEQGGTPDENP